MRIAFTVVAQDFDSLQDALTPALDAVIAVGRPVSDTAGLGEAAMDIFVDGADIGALRVAARRAFERKRVDFCVQPAAGRRKRLLIADMDSTIISCECLDELADFAGVKPQVAAITERAMAGEIPFEAALRERVAMLKGLSLSKLQETYDQRVKLTPGAATLAKTMAAHGATCLLVSGGFEFFTERVSQAAGFSGHKANRMVDDGQVLTGEVTDPILGREAKLETLRAYASDLGIDLAATLAVGDGANDLAMIEAAGLGVAYRAKPIVAAQAAAQVNHTDLTSLLFFQGYGADEFA